MRLARLAAYAATAAFLIGCAKSDAPADSVAVGVPEAGTTAATSSGTTAAPIALADLAGTWKFRGTPTSGADTSVTEYTLTSTGTTEGWKITYTNGQSVPVQVTASGDSIITVAGPYQSVRRRGVQVTTNGVFRKDGDKLVGTTVAHYNTKGADSVLTLRTEGARVP